MAVVKRRSKAKQDEVMTVQDLFGLGDMGLPRSRADLIARNRPDGKHWLATAVVGDAPEGDEPHGVTNEYIWHVERRTPMKGAPYVLISKYQIVNPEPGVWMAAWKGCEGTRGFDVNLDCPVEFFDLVPLMDAAWLGKDVSSRWREAVRSNPDRKIPSILEIKEGSSVPGVEQ